MTSYDEVIKFHGNGPLLRQAPFTSDDCRRACFNPNMYVGSELFAKQISYVAFENQLFYNFTIIFRWVTMLIPQQCDCYRCYLADDTT